MYDSLHPAREWQNHSGTRSWHHNIWGNLNASYEFDSMNSISGWFGTYPSFSNDKTDDTTTRTDYDIVGTPHNMSYLAGSQSSGSNNGGFGGLWFTHKFDKKGHQYSINLDGNWWSWKRNETSWRHYDYQPQMNYDHRIASNDLSGNGSIGIDYSYPYSEQGEIETGLDLGMGGGYELYLRDTMDADKVPPLVHNQRERLGRIVGRGNKRRIGDVDVALRAQETHRRKVRTVSKGIIPYRLHTRGNRHRSEIQVLAIGKSIIFNEEYHNKKHFNYFFDTISDIVQVSKYAFEREDQSAIKEIIMLISQMDIFDNAFSYSNVFEVISSSRIMNLDSNPSYIIQILASLIFAEKKSLTNAYDPFMKNGNSLMELFNYYGFDLKNVYGKEIDTLCCCCAIVKFFINNISFGNVFLKQEDAVKSIDLNGASFDAILSHVPIAIKNYRSELEEILLKNFDMDSDSFTQDIALNNALENLVEKMDFEKDSNMDFIGEYESLKDSEFLFLINLIDSLKDDGIMAISISQNFLFKNSLETLRKYLTYEHNYIDAVINIPHEIDRHKRPEVVIVFRKNKANRDILFIDMSNDYETRKSSLIFPGLFRKNLILDNKTINKMMDVFSNKLTISKYSRLISIEEIIQNRFNLSVSRYVDTFEGEFVELSELVDEKEDIDANIKMLNKKIEKMMNELDVRF